MRKWSFILVATLVLFVSTTSAHAPDAKAIGKKAMSFVLEDQFGKSWTWDQHWKGKPTVLILADRTGSEYTKNWTDQLTSRYKDKVQFVAFADVSLAPGFIKSYIKERFREAFSNSILMDWDGDVFEYYHVQDGLPNVIYIDETETVRLHTWGTGKAEHVQQLTNVIDRLLAR
ncbi:hypothetical protein BH10BAC6_BH10BAC6_14850 [soil metagenome]